jgi:hypothetical protein
MEGKIRRVADGDINNDFNTVAHSKVRHPRFPCAKPRSTRTVTGHKVKNGEFTGGVGEDERIPSVLPVYATSIPTWKHL